MSGRPGLPEPAIRGHLLRWLRRSSLRRTRSTPRSSLLAALHLTPSRRSGQLEEYVLPDGFWGALGPRVPLALLLGGGIAWLLWWNVPMAMGEAVQTQTKETRAGGAGSAEGAEQRITKILAKGNVRIVRGEQTATSQEALYLREEEKIVLTGDAKVWEGKNMVSGRQITLFLDEDTSLVEQEVKVIFYPKTKREESPSRGKAAKRNGPVVITASKMRADHREKTVTFEQEVVVRREETTLYADHVTVFYQ